MYERYEFEVLPLYMPHTSPGVLRDRLNKLGNLGFSVACTIPDQAEGHIRIVMQRAIEVQVAGGENDEHTNP
jgi:hypothetical protein